MFLIIWKIDLGSHLLSLLSQVIIGIVTYFILIMVLDAEVRAAILRLVKREKE
jgi:hypothetical protein